MTTCHRNQPPCSVLLLFTFFCLPSVKMNVRTYFPEMGKWYNGIVLNTTTDDDGPTLHHVKYNDGDSEDVDDCDLNRMRANYDLYIKVPIVSSLTHVLLRRLLSSFNSFALSRPSFTSHLFSLPFINVHPWRSPKRSGFLHKNVTPPPARRRRSRKGRMEEQGRHPDHHSCLKVLGTNAKALHAGRSGGQTKSAFSFLIVSSSTRWW